MTLSPPSSFPTHQTWCGPGSGPAPAQTLPLCPAEQHARTGYGCWHQSGRSCGTGCASAEGLLGCGLPAGWSLERAGSAQQQRQRWSSQTCRWRKTGRPESWRPGERGPCLLSTGHRVHPCGHLQREMINTLRIGSSMWPSAKGMIDVLRIGSSMGPSAKGDDQYIERGHMRSSVGPTAKGNDQCIKNRVVHVAICKGKGSICWAWGNQCGHLQRENDWCIEDRVINVALCKGNDWCIENRVISVTNCKGKQPIRWEQGHQCDQLQSEWSVHRG